MTHVSKVALLQSGRSTSTTWSIIPLCIAALLATVLVTAASYPGYMSYDSVQELLQARTHVEGSQYPPFGSYVWRFFDWIAPGPTLMQFVQNFLLEVSFACLISRTRLSLLIKLTCIVAFTASPPILGTMLVVWKDVAVGACYMTALAILFSITPDSSRSFRWSAVLLGLFFVWSGMAYRFNAASGAVPLIVYAMWHLRDRPRSHTVNAKAIFGVVAWCVLAFVVMCASVWVLNNYRLPSFERLERNTNADSIMMYDLIGMSAFSGAELVPATHGGSVSPEYLMHIYDPRHLNITAINDQERRIASKVNRIPELWFSAIVHHPFAYFIHRISVFREYIGFHRHEVFYPTEADISPNDLGVISTPTPFKNYVTQYLWNARLTVLSRAWIYYAVSLGLVVASFWGGARRHRVQILVCSLSAYLYLLPMFFITPAADLRYNFWSLCGCVLAAILAVASLLDGKYLHRENC